MVLSEFVLHGWDLARASGAAWTCPDAAAAAVLAAAVEMGPVARSMGVYGPEVPVESAAPVLDRAVGAAGRDPDWTSVKVHPAGLIAHREQTRGHSPHSDSPGSR